MIMFILNFEVMTDGTFQDHKEDLNHRLPTWLVTGRRQLFQPLPALLPGPLSSSGSRKDTRSVSPGRPRGFKLRLPLLRSLSNSKVSLDDTEAGHIPTATPLPLNSDHHSHESLGLGEFLPLPTLQKDHAEQLSGSR